MTRMRPHSGMACVKAVVAVAAILIPGLCMAGGGPHNWIAVYDPGDPHSVAVAHYYQQARSFPEANMMPYLFPRVDDATNSIKDKLTASECWTLIGAIRAHATERGILDQIHGVTLLGRTPTTVSTASGFSGSAGITSALAVAPGTTTQSQWENRVDDYSMLFRGTDFAGAIPMPTTEIRSDLEFFGQRYWLSTVMAYTGLEGLRPDEVFHWIDRGVGADGTAPEGTVYRCVNDDHLRSGTREWQIAPTTAEWDSLGLAYAVEGRSYDGTVYGGIDDNVSEPRNKTGAPGSYPVNQRAIQGVIAGGRDTSPDTAGSLYLPGALAEHMTSLGGKFGDVFAWGQMPITEWIRYGATGSSGTVMEPTALWYKFAHARLHTHYFNGATLAEAFAQAQKLQYQNITLGEALCQPYAKIPQVAIANVADGATLSGSIPLQVSASGERPLEANLDLAIDGRVIATGESLTLDTTTLSDGWHELRVIAYNADAVRTQGVAVRGVFVNNAGASVSLTGDASVDRGDTVSLTATVSGVANATGVEIRFCGQVLATLSAGGGSVEIDADRLGYQTPNRLYAVALTADDRPVSSGPHTVAVHWAPKPPIEDLRVASRAIAQARYFPNATAPGFDWDTASPAAVQLVDDRNELRFTGTGDYPFLEDGGETETGIEFITGFLARETAIYDFAFQGGAQFEFLVDGESLIRKTKTTSGIHFAPVMLEAGWHELRVRVWDTNALSGLDVAVRAPYTIKFTGSGVSDDLIYDFEYLALEHVRAIQPETLGGPELALEVTSPGSLAFAWRDTLVNESGWEVGRDVASSGVELTDVGAYLGTNTPPEIHPRFSDEGMRPDARVSNDDPERWTNVPALYAEGDRLITARADNGDKGANILYKVNVPAGVSIYAIVNSSNKQPTWMSNQGGWESFGMKPESELTRRYVVWVKRPSATAATVELGGPGTTSGIDAHGISFVFLREPSRQGYSGPSTTPSFELLDSGDLLKKGGFVAIDKQGSNDDKWKTVPTWLQGERRLFTAQADNADGGATPLHNILVPPGFSVYAIFEASSDSVQPAWMSAQSGWSFIDETIASNQSTDWKIWKRGPLEDLESLDLGGPLAGKRAISYVFIREDDWLPIATAPTNATTAVATGQPGGLQRYRLRAEMAPDILLPGPHIAIDPSVPTADTAPSVHAGEEFSTSLPAPAVPLTGSATDTDTPSASLTFTWSKLDGPGSVTFADASSATTSASFGTVGSHTLQLEASDGVSSGFDTVVVNVVGGAVGNTAPSVEAGANQSIHVAQSIPLQGSVADDGLPAPASSLTVAWRQLSGPGTVTFVDRRNPVSLAHFPAAGSYVLELSASDGSATSTDTVTFTASSNPNAAPSVDLGPPRHAFFGAPLVLNPSVADDGNPAPPGTLAVQWYAMSGPSWAEFTSDDTSATSVNFGAVGDYVLRLVASDGARTTVRDLQVNVAYDDGENAAPLVNAGADTSVDFPKTLQLNATATDDGRPAPPGVMTHAWSKLSGPGDILYELIDGGPDALMKFTAAGNYELQLESSDGNLSATDRVLVTVRPAAGRVVYAWGYNFRGQAGVPTTDSFVTTPFPIEGGVRDMEPGQNSSYAVRVNGEFSSTGLNSQGSLGDPGLALGVWRRSFVAVPGLTNIVQASTSRDGGAALDASGRVWTWGDNDSGQLGDGTTADRPTPALVPGLDGVIAIACGSDRVLALKSDGTVVGWGDNYGGELGTGLEKNDYLTPIAMSGVDDAVAIAAGSIMTAILREDGTVWTCGAAGNRELGQGDGVLKSLLPGQVADPLDPSGYLQDVVKIVMDLDHCLALKADGTVMAWGENYYGKLGNGTTNGVNTAIPVPGLIGIVDIAASESNSFAVASDGTLYAWGRAATGMLANGIAGGPDRLSPAAVTGLPPIAQIFATSETAFAVTPWSHDAYAAQFFPRAEIDAGLAAPLVDSDGDSRVTLLEYVLRTDPRAPDRPALYRGIIDGEEFVFEVELADVPDATVAFETSTDLMQWDPATPVRHDIQSRGDYERHSLRFSLGSDPLFLRLNVNLIAE